MNRMIKTCIASVISEVQQSDIYLTVKARLFETPGANLNGVRVTPAFLSEIVEHQEKYVGLPLCADVKALADGNYQHLGHLYDARTGEFHSAQIGSFYQFDEEKTADGAALIGYARIMKRNKAVCHAISELFADNALKFSFEISCGSYRELDDGTIEIDASDDNYLEGAAVVTFPACESAVALDLVAECNNLADGKEGETMTDVNETSVTAEEQVAEEVNAEEKLASEAVNEEAEPTVETAETADEKTEEVAELIVKDNKYEAHDIEVIDTDTGMRTEEHMTHETRTVTPMSVDPIVDAPVDNSVQVVEFAQDDAVPGSEPQTIVIEEMSAEVKNDEAETEDDEDPEDEMASKKKCCSETEDAAKPVVETAEETPADALTVAIAEVKAEIELLRKELAELKVEPVKVCAESALTFVSEANPFIAEMPMEGVKKYTLLESETPVSEYTLI